MQSTSRKIDVKSCEKTEPPHSCDSPPICDPLKEDDGDCPSPVLCLEKIKNPAYDGEITKCTTGNFINVKSCQKKEPQHICDAPPPCNKDEKKRPCEEPSLCLHRIKNPEKKNEITKDCDL